jgi:hypothetical protein
MDHLWLLAIWVGVLGVNAGLWAIYKRLTAMHETLEERHDG